MYICIMKTQSLITVKQDYRRLSREQREVLRNRGITMIKSGIKKSDVAKFLGTNNTTVSFWWKRYKTEGCQGLKEKKCGAKSENCKLLTEEQEIKVQRLITDRFPEQYKLSFALWTRKAVKELVKQQFNIDISIRTIGDYLHSWGFTPQKPQKRAYEQNPVSVNRWLSEQ
jgi:transposase